MASGWAFSKAEFKKIKGISNITFTFGHARFYSRSLKRVKWNKNMWSEKIKRVSMPIVVRCIPIRMNSNNCIPIGIHLTDIGILALCFS